LLDGSRSYSDSRIEQFEWTFTNGEGASGQRIERTYLRPGTYSEILKITDDRGRTDQDFERVNVLDPQHPEQTPPSIQAAYWPTMGILPGASVTFKVRTFATTDGQETGFFGDGGTARTKSDGGCSASRQRRFRHQRAPLSKTRRLYRACGAHQRVGPESRRAPFCARGRRRVSALSSSGSDLAVVG